MSWWHALRARLWLLFAVRSTEARMDAEFRFHVDMETEANIRAGLSPAEARRRAMIAFGGMERHREGMRDDRGARWLDDLTSDIRYALRTLARMPGFAAVAVLTVGFGVGASGSIFCIAYGILLRPLPYEEPERFVRILRTTGSDELSTSVSPPNFMSLREQNRAFTEVAVFDGEDVTLTGQGEARWIEGAEVSAGFFEVVGARPIAGRTFVEGENLPGNDNVAVISHALWQQLTGGTTEIIGTTVHLHERPRVVVGVMPAGFDFPYGSDVWIPLTYNETYSAASTEGRRNYWLNTIARLREDVTLEDARSDLSALSRRLEDQFPEANREFGLTAVPFRDVLVWPVRTMLLLVLAAVGVLLLIACANVAGLFLARGTSRQEELALRVALGASRSRIARQLITESLMVSLIGGALGLLIAIWATRLIVAAPPQGLPRVDAIRIDGAVVAFSIALTLVAGLMTGVVPALQATRAAVSSRLPDGGRSTIARSAARGRSFLVSAEIALAVVLLACAGLLIRSFARMASTDPGFQTAGGVSFLVRLPDSYATEDDKRLYFQELLRQLGAVPGVNATGAVHRLPMAQNGFSTRVLAVDTRGLTAAEHETSIVYRSVTPGYFDAMRIPTRRGRGLTADDGSGDPPVAVINETAARRLFGVDDPVGRRITISAGGDVPLTIVGVTGDAIDYRVREIQEPQIFLSVAQYFPSSYLSVVVRGSGDPLALIPAIRRVLQQVDPSVPGLEFRTLEAVVDDSLGRERLLSWLLGVFAVAALLLSAIGIFGLFSFTVSQRTRELAVRAAIGARRTELVLMVLRDALKLAAIGLAIGLAGAVAATRALESQLYGVSTLDPTTFAAVIALLAVTAVVATLLPARRAARADPMTALRRG